MQRPPVLGDNPPDVRLTAVFALAACAVSAAAQDAVYADAAARQMVERARTAVLGSRRPDDLRSFIFKGRIRLPTATDATRDGTVELKILLPDRYLRVETIDGVTRRSGFAGATPLGDGATLAAERAEFARLMLGALVYAPPDPKLRLQSTGESAFADTEALDVSGPSFSARLVFDAAAHVPMRVVLFGERQTSIVVSFANRRAVDGIALPFRVTTQTPDRVLETLMFDEILVNPELRDEDFRP